MKLVSYTLKKKDRLGLLVGGKIYNLKLLRYVQENFNYCRRGNKAPRTV